MAEPAPRVPDLPPADTPRRRRKAATRTAIILAAAFGGISPNLLRMAVSLTGDKGELPLNGTYWIGLLLFGFLGGAMSLIWGETEIRRAYYLGLGLPSLLQVGVSSVTEKDGKRDQQQEERPADTPQNGASLWFFTPPAYAQSIRARTAPEAIERQQDVIVEVQPDHKIVLDSSKNRRLFLQLGNIPEGTELLLYEEKNLKSWVVLGAIYEGTTLNQLLFDSITEFRVQIGDAQSEMIPVSPQPGSTSTFRVDVDKNLWSGFLQALGARNVSKYKVGVERVEPPR
jgi:hypothetical protein